MLRQAANRRPNRKPVPQAAKATRIVPPLASASGNSTAVNWLESMKQYALPLGVSAAVCAMGLTSLLRSGDGHTVAALDAPQTTSAPLLTTSNTPIPKEIPSRGQDITTLIGQATAPLPLSETFRQERLAKLEQKAKKVRLTPEQTRAAQWLSQRYAVSNKTIAPLVSEAFRLGRQHKVDPALILAVAAIESGFNPFAQSPVGAQGLMQVLTRVHVDKFNQFGGAHAAFDPIANLHVGVSILRDYIARTGSVEGGLKYYVGAANMTHDGGYGQKVIREYAQLYKLVTGQTLTLPSANMPALSNTAMADEQRIQVTLPATTSSGVAGQPSPTLPVAALAAGAATPSANPTLVAIGTTNLSVSAASASQAVPEVNAASAVSTTTATPVQPGAPTHQPQGALPIPVNQPAGHGHPVHHI